MIEERLYSTGNDDLDYILEKAFSDGFEYAQKEYSHWTTKVLYNLGRAGEAVFHNFPAKTSQATLKTLLTPENYKRHAISRYTKEPDIKIKRKAIERRNKISRGVGKSIINAKKGWEYAKTTEPGQIVADTVEKAIDKGLVATTGTVAGYVPLVTSGLYIPGTAAISGGLEVLARKKVPGYKKLSTRLAEKFKKSKAKEVIAGISDGIIKSIG